ncbi:hypothetical protein FB45DRAFT_1028443 [Roridomyces roridus]|uniref:F-box domain-containing protein n=1 Tax=Roridomyces roridus TaxID=1738132 RepID=A0AAD7BQU5_9AGAR|nr:hypothetical protein FB45DRAFT_1028443 [Roridomyces roridus]
MEIPELLHYSLQYLDACPASLTACAVVHRSWTFTAQSHLFRHVFLAIYWGDPDLDLDRRCSLLLTALSASPHLARFVCSLEITPERLSSEVLEALLNIPLAMLHTLYLAYAWPQNYTVPAMERLVSIPTLQHVQIHYQHAESPNTFQRLNRNLSPKITKMEVFRPP